MKSTQHILVVSSNPSLETELQAALPAVRGRTGSTRRSRSLREGIEDARLHAPDVVLVELGKDVGEVRAFAEEMAVVAPSAVVAVAYERTLFEEDGAEGDALILLTRARVSDFLHRPISAADLRRLLDRSHHRIGPGRSRLGTLVSFVSNKGGVGKSTVAVNTAAHLGKRFPGQVLLVDCSLQHGIAASMLDLKPQRTIADATRELDRLDETLLREHAMVHESGLHVLAAPADILSASEIDEKGVARVLGLARRTYDYVIVDTFPTVDAIVICVLDMCDLIFVVVQPIVPLVLGIAGLYGALDELNVSPDRVRLILNRGVRPFHGELSAGAVGDRLGVDVAHVVPFERRLAVALNSGQPQILRHPRRTSFTRAIKRISNDIADTYADSGRIPHAREDFTPRAEAEIPVAHEIEQD
jgi:pilus assembly protein CpaE